MTFEEIQKTLEGMLAVQRDIQESQIRTNETLDRLTQKQGQTYTRIARLSAKIDNLTENVSNLNIVSQRHEDRFTQYYGYHQSTNSDRLRLLESQRRIERRLDSIEDKLDAR